MKRLAECLAKERVVFLASPDKPSALNELVNAIATAPSVGDAERLRKAIFDRERILSTGIGLGIAVPHAKIQSVGEFLIAVGVSPQGIAFDSLDGKSVKIIVMIAGPDNRQDQYLKLLAITTLFLKSTRNREAILAAKTPEEVYKLFAEGE